MKKSCDACVYAASCSYYTATAPKMEERLGMISFEFVENWSELLADTTHVPGAEEPEKSHLRQRRFDPEPEIPGMAQFLRFILELDDYTLAILSQIIVPRSDASAPCSMAELARAHHCTRQAIHRKFLRTAHRNPELARLLQLTFCKVRQSRSAFLRGNLKRGRHRRHA